MFMYQIKCLLQTSCNNFMSFYNCCLLTHFILKFLTVCHCITEIITPTACLQSASYGMVKFYNIMWQKQKTKKKCKKLLAKQVSITKACEWCN